ncbi:protein SPT2 homolog isoform X2 [Pieris napi]|uniref:protein SPT2 homolog isoform X2 n=1 Tax=Pieris napi TaxID=78633 RepID=UPI001FBAD05F|nr:protein SPT2 homolog isoform X2 [Pieris napi]
MKLLILLSIVACSYGDKLDRTYLPPANAGSAGGSPGALTAPGVSNFGTTGPANQPLGQPPIGQPSRPNSFGQGNQQTPGKQESGSLNFESNRPFGFTSGSGATKPSQVYGPADSTPNQGNNGLVSGFGPSNSQGNQPQSLESNTPNKLGQQSFGNSFGPNAASPSGYSQINGQNFVGSSSRPESERPQAAADRNAEILKYVNENDGDRFTYSFETTNGITAEETGVASGGVKAQGGYSYTGDDGKAYTITYTADEQGYQPQGEHLPTPPPIPEEILRSIEKNAQAAAAGTQEGAYRPEDYENEDNSQGYSGATSINKPQGQDQFSSQQYTAPIDKPASSQIGFQQTKPGFQNVPTSETSYKDRFTNGVSSFEPIRSFNQNAGSINQAQLQRRPGYEYSRPQNTQDTKQAFGSQPGQSRPQFGSQIPSNSPFSKSGNGQELNPFNGASRPESQTIPSGQDYFKPSQVSQYQQSGFKPTSNQPGQGPQSKLSSAQNYNQESSGYQYQPGNSGFGVTARPSFPNQPSFQNLDQGATPQRGNQYQTNPSNNFSNRPSSNQPGQGPESKLSSAQNYNQQSSGYQYQPANSGFGVTARPSFPNQPQGGNQYQTNPSNQFSNRPLNQQYQQNTQGITPSSNGFNTPNGAPQNQVSVTSNNLPVVANSIAKQTAPIQAPYQYQRPSQPFNQNQLSQNGFRQPASQGQIPSGANKPAFGSPQTSYNQPIQSQGPLQSSFNQNPGQSQTNPSQIQGSSSGFNRPTQDQGSKPVFPSANQPEQFSGPRQPPSYNAEEGYKY